MQHLFKEVYVDHFSDLSGKFVKEDKIIIPLTACEDGHK